MTRDEALRLLGSSDSLARLDAARELLTLAVQSDRNTIVAKRRNEPDRWVRAALDRALLRLSGAKPPTVSSSRELTLDPLDDDQRVRATREVAGAITHELRSILGSARAAARAELNPFEKSRTARALERMDRFLLALDEIVRASTPALEDEFDLSTLIREAVADAADFSSNGVEIRVAGPESLVVLGDPKRLEVAIVNGLRNAIDAVNELPVSDDQLPVLVTWGATDDDVWVAIADRGPGLASGHDQAFDIGQTTKAKAEHQGMGLAIARRSMRSMRGDVSLAPRDGGGTVFEARWPRGQGQ